MDEIVENCRLFIKKTKCDFNTTTQQCEETKTSLAKYCSNKKCQGDYEVFVSKTTMIILATTHELIDCFPTIGENNIPFTNAIVDYEREENDERSSGVINGEENVVW